MTPSAAAPGDTHPSDATEDADEEWEEDSLYEIAMAAAVVTVIASCKIIAAKKRRMIWVRPIFQRRAEFGAYMLIAENSAYIPVSIFSWLLIRANAAFRASALL